MQRSKTLVILLLCRWNGGKYAFKFVKRTHVFIDGSRLSVVHCTLDMDAVSALSSEWEVLSAVQSSYVNFRPAMLMTVHRPPEASPIPLLRR